MAGKHYGISLQFGPNVLMVNTKLYGKTPNSWAAIYDARNKGKITIPDNPIQIADAALYLSKTKPRLGIKDPYELTKVQLAAAVALLKQQRPLVKKYWGLASDQIDLFANGSSTIGASWPYQVNALKGAKKPVPVVGVIPKEGVTGWADTWMLSSKAKHPNCAYKWMQYITKPVPQAQQAIYFGETPVNKKACAGDELDLEGLLRAVLGQRARELLQLDQVLEDADCRLRQRPEQLHRTPGLDDGLAADQGVEAVAADPARVTEGSPRGSPPLALPVFVAATPG